MVFSIAYKNESNRITRTRRFGDRIDHRRQTCKQGQMLSPKRLVFIVLLPSVYKPCKKSFVLRTLNLHILRMYSIWLVFKPHYSWLFFVYFFFTNHKMATEVALRSLSSFPFNFLSAHKFWNIYTFLYIPLYLWFQIVIEDETGRLSRNVGKKIPLHAEQ